MLVVEVPLHAVGRVQVNVYGPVPPLAAALHVKALPEVRPVVGHVTVFATGCPPTVAVAEAEAVAVLASLTVLLIE